MSYVGIYHFVENLKMSDPEGYKDFNFSEGELESVYEYDIFKEKGYSDDEIKEIPFVVTDVVTKDSYIIQFMNHIIETSNKDVSNVNLAADILGLRNAFNQEINLLEQKYGDKLHEVYRTVESRNTELEDSYHKDWNEAMDEYRRGSSPDFPSVDDYNPYNDDDYVESFEEGVFLSSIAMSNALNKLPEYMKDNIKDLSFNLDEAEEYNDNFLIHHLVYTYPSMCDKYNAIANDSTFCAHLDGYKKFINYLANYDYDAFENNEHDGVGDDEYDDVGDDAI